MFSFACAGDFRPPFLSAPDSCPLKTSFEPVREIVETVDGWVAPRLVMKSVPQVLAQVANAYHRQPTFRQLL